MKRQVNLDPAVLCEMDSKQKRDCMDEINGRIKVSWYYSAILSLVVMLFAFVYTLVSTVYTLRFQKLLDPLNLAIFVVPVVIFLPAFFANMMKFGGIIAAMVAYSGVAVYFVVLNSVSQLWMFPAGVIGAVLSFRLLRCFDMYKALEKEEGFPEFTSIEENAVNARTVIEMKRVKSEPLNILTETAILAEKSRKKTAEAQEKLNNGEK